MNVQKYNKTIIKCYKCKWGGVGGVCVSGVGGGGQTCAWAVGI